MDRFTNIIGRIVRGGTIAGSIFLLVVVLIVVTNVVIRFFGHMIPGHYELVSLITVISVAFTLSYTAIHKGHIAMNILVSRLSQRNQIIMGAFTTIVSIAVWAAIAWASITVINDKMLKEVSNMLLIPYLPFRCVWVLGLILYCLVLVTDLFMIKMRKKQANEPH
jgi:TRAP-type C4-dicarboxylate transport system permease small subunit